MRRQRIRHQHVFQRGTLLADLHVAVAVGPLEVVVAFHQPGIFLLVFRDDLLRQHQNAAGLQCREQLGDHRIAVRRRQKLQREVEHDHAAGPIAQIADIALDELDPVVGAFGDGGFAGPGDHRRREVDAGQLEGIGGQSPGQRQPDGAQRAAQIVDVCAMAQVAFGDDAEHAENLAVAGNRTPDHVREARHDLLVEREARHTIKGCRKDGVTVRCVNHCRKIFLIGRA